MRQILFRGKRKDNGEWVEGHNIIITERRAFIVPSGEYIDDCRTKTGRLILIMPQIEVIPETVGQYTGLSDKNGKKIFEGDIVKAERWYDSGCYPHAEMETFEVKIPDIYQKGIKSIEIVGNIFNNPELLGGDKE